MTNSRNKSDFSMKRMSYNGTVNSNNDNMDSPPSKYEVVNLGSLTR